MPDLVHQFHVAASAEVLFAAISTPEGLNSWWTLESSGQPQIGTQYRFYFGPKYDWLATVVAAEADRSITWQMLRAMDDWIPTCLEFRLSPDNGGCKVHFAHRGWQAESEHFAISNFCWGQLLKGLKDYVEHSIVVQFDRRN